MCEYGGVEEVWFLVSGEKGFKEKESLVEEDVGVKMVEGGVGG